MENNIKGVDRINRRIVEEAKALAAEDTAKAEKEAEGIIINAKNVSDEKTGEILAKAKEKAASVIDSAKSSAGMNRRNRILSLKVHMMEKAFDEAFDKLSSLPEEKYQKVLSLLLTDAVNCYLNDGDKAFVYFSDKDKPFASGILSSAKENIKVKADISVGDRKLSFKSGFVLAVGDTEINCDIKSLINSARKDLEKPVLNILFPE